jgi:peptide/nickel transport system permease protein
VRVDVSDGRPSLLWFAARRAVFVAALVLLASSCALLLVRAAPGDATGEMRVEGVSSTTIAAERARLGLDRTAGQQYWDWARAALRLDFGTSFRYARPVGPLVIERALNTTLLAVTALLLATVVGVPLGVFTAARAGTWLARCVSAASVVALSLPPMLLSLVFAAWAARTGWLPIGGMRSAAVPPGSFGAALDLARHLVLPALALAIPVAAVFERLQSGSLSSTLRAPCLLAAETRGLPPRRLFLLHGLRLSLTPVASLYGLVAGGLLSGSFAVEVVTAWPGLGRLMYEGLVSRDLYLVAGCAAIGAAFVGAGAVLSEILAAWNDPRLRAGSLE